MNPNYIGNLDYGRGYVDGISQLGHCLKMTSAKNVDQCTKNVKSQMNPKFSQNDDYVRGFIDGYNQLGHCVLTTSNNYDQCSNNLMQQVDSAEHFSSSNTDIFSSYNIMVLVLIIILIVWWRIERNIIKSIYN